MAALSYIRPALGGLPPGAEYIPYGLYPEAPGAIYNAGDFLSIVTTGTILFPTPAGSISTFVPTSAPTVGTTARSGEATHTLFAWYSLTGTGGQGVLESTLYEIGPVTNAPGQSVTITVPADSNYPAAATHFLVYVGTLPNQQWLQTSTTGTALGSAFTIPAWPLTNNTGVNRVGNDPSSGIVGYAPYPNRTGYSGGPGYTEDAGVNWRASFGIDQSLSGNQSLLEQYRAQVVKLQNNMPVSISCLQAWNDGLIGATAGIVYSTTYGVFYVDTGQSNGIFTIQGGYGGIPGPYNPNAPVIGNTGTAVFGYFNSGLA